jgi:hypothetical protein
MEPRRSGLVHTWDVPKRCFQYSYIPRYNETLEIVELPFGSLSPPENGGRKLSIKDVPPEVAAEINISLGSSGMYYYTRTWWERRQYDFAAWQKRVRIRFEIWGLKLQILRNHFRMAGKTIVFLWKMAGMRLALAGQWCKQRWQDFKIAVIDALLGDRK